MKTLVLLGGGGHCQSVIDTVLRNGLYHQLIILDTPKNVGKNVYGEYTVAGTDEALPEMFRKGYREAFVAVAGIKDTALRHRLAEKIKDSGFSLVNIIDSSAVISEKTDMGQGIFIGKGAIVNAGVSIGDLSIINSGAIVEHNVKVGKFCHISVGSVLCGDVTIRDNCFIGANATVIQGVHIGDNSIVGAGSLVYKDVAEGSKVYGGNK